MRNNNADLDVPWFLSQVNQLLQKLECIVLRLSTRSSNSIQFQTIGKPFHSFVRESLFSISFLCSRRGLLTANACPVCSATNPLSVTHCFSTSQMNRMTMMTIYFTVSRWAGWSWPSQHSQCWIRWVLQEHSSKSNTCLIPRWRRGNFRWGRRLRFCVRCWRWRWYIRRAKDFLWHVAQTLNNFLTTKLCKSSSEVGVSTEQPKKKRFYDNSGRAEAAAARRASKPEKTSRVVARNNPDSQTELIIFECLISSWRICCWIFLLCTILFSLLLCWQTYSKKSDPPRFQERVATLIQKPCKCSSGQCNQQYSRKEVQDFLNLFQDLNKQEQDSILFKPSSQSQGIFFLSKPISRNCMETLLGISSHRTDRVGQVDLRYGKRAHTRPSELTASIDSFLTVVYNSIAEPLPDRLLEVVSCFAFICKDVYWNK